MLLLFLLWMMIIWMNDKARPYYIENDFKRIRKREAVIPKKNITIVDTIPETNHESMPQTKKKVIRDGIVKNTTKPVISKLPRDKTIGKLSETKN